MARIVSGSAYAPRRSTGPPYRLRDRYGRRDLIAQPFVELVGLGEDGLGVAEKLRRNQHEMHIVGIVADRIHADRAGLCDIGFVDLRGRLVDFEQVRVAADAVVDVAGHVDDVSGSRHQRGKPVGIGFGAFRTVRGFHEMNVEMDRPGMVGVLCENAFQALLDIGRTPFGLLAARLPVIPGLSIHCRLGSQHRQFEVVRIFVRQGGHCVCKGRVELRPFCRRILRISRGHGLDQRLFLLARASGKGLCLLEAQRWPAHSLRGPSAR